MLQKGGGDYTLADDYRDLCKHGSLFACMWEAEQEEQAKKKAKADKKKGKGAKKGEKGKG